MLPKRTTDDMEVVADDTDPVWREQLLAAAASPDFPEFVVYAADQLNRMGVADAAVVQQVVLFAMQCLESSARRHHASVASNGTGTGTGTPSPSPASARPSDVHMQRVYLDALPSTVACDLLQDLLHAALDRDPRASQTSALQATAAATVLQLAHLRPVQWLPTYLARRDWLQLRLLASLGDTQIHLASLLGLVAAMLPEYVG